MIGASRHALSNSSAPHGAAAILLPACRKLSLVHERGDAMPRKIFRRCPRQALCARARAGLPWGLVRAAASTVYFLASGRLRNNPALDGRRASAFRAHIADSRRPEAVFARCSESGTQSCAPHAADSFISRMEFRAPRSASRLPAPSSRFHSSPDFVMQHKACLPCMTVPPCIPAGGGPNQTR